MTKTAPESLDEARKGFDVKAHLATLDGVYADAEAQFGAHNPGRLDQLRSALDTAAMAVTHLGTETPYTPA